MHDAERWIIPFSNASYAHLALQNGIGVIQHRIDGVCGISVGRQFEERWRHPEGERVFPFGFLLSLQAKSRLEMAKDDPEALSHELWQRREPRPAAPYLKRAIDAKDHAFDRE